MAFVKIVAYSTKYSQAVTHPSTNSAQCCLTAVIRRELVYSTWYGCRHSYCIYFQNLYLKGGEAGLLVVGQKKYAIYNESFDLEFKMLHALFSIDQIHTKRYKICCQEWDLNPCPQLRTRILFHLYSLFRSKAVTLSLAP